MKPEPLGPGWESREREGRKQSVAEEARSREKALMEKTGMGESLERQAD